MLGARPWLRQELCRRKGSFRQNIGKKGIPGQTDGGGRVKNENEEKVFWGQQIRKGPRTKVRCIRLAA